MFALEETRTSDNATVEPAGAFVLDQSMESGEPSCADEPLFGLVTFSVAGLDDTTDETVPTATVTLPASALVFSEVHIGGSVVQKPVADSAQDCGYAMQLLTTRSIVSIAV